MKSSSKTGRIVALLALCLAWPQAQAKTIRVDCDARRTIQERLEKAEPGDRIAVSGTCNENVTIPESQSGITLDGQGAAVLLGPDATQGTLVVHGRNITIRGLTIRGGQDGIAVRDGGTAVIDGNTVEATGEDGISVSRHSSARIVNNTVRNNPRDGVRVNESSSAEIGVLSGKDSVASPNFIGANARRGVTVSRSSNARIVGNSITANGDDGVHITRDAQADAAGNVIDGNAGHGISVTQNSGGNLSDGAEDSALLAQPNSGSNARFGIRCNVGAYITGSRGGLTGASGAVKADQGCVDDTGP